MKTQTKIELRVGKKEEEKSYQFSGKTDVQSISLKDFFLFSLDERLSLVSTPQKINSEFSKGENIAIDFRGNKELEHGISLSELLPKTVRKVVVKGEKASRDPLTGEYFTKNEKRVRVYSGSIVTIHTVKTTEEVQEIRKETLGYIAKDMPIELFFHLPKEKRLQLVTQKTKECTEVAQGDILHINFHGNINFEHGIGLRDILPDWVNRVRVIDTHRQQKTGERKGDIFVGANEKRMVIHSGFLVEIVR